MDKLLEYFDGDELAANVWKSKYAAEGEETPDDMHKRMAKEFARVEKGYIEKEEELNAQVTFDGDEALSDYCMSREPLTEDSIYELFKDFKYIVPQGRVMAGLGVTEQYKSLSNCLRLPAPLDSYPSIMYTDTMLVLAAKRGNGFGLSISNLRPEGTSTKNAAHTSTGATSFMARYSNSTREVGQNSRRGACLIDIDINHPDVMEFITSKEDKTKITGANISIFLNDVFMEAVENDTDYILGFPCDIDANTLYNNSEFDMGEYGVLETFSKIQTRKLGGLKFAKKIRAKEYWDKIVINATNNAEPGIFYRTMMDNYSPSNVYEKYKEKGTNACGEQPMADFDSCRLILQNLFSIVVYPFTDSAHIDFELLYKVSYELLRLNDDLVDLEVESIDRILDKIELDPEPLEQKVIEKTLWTNIRDMAVSGRRVGAGLTGLGDMFAALGITYGSVEAKEIIKLVMHTKMKAELDCTIDLAITRGTFKGWDANLEFHTPSDIMDSDLVVGGNDFYEFILAEFLEQAKKMFKYGRRNINLSTVAPGGSVSLLTQTTSGLEPLFMPYYMRRKKINPNDKGVRVDFTDDSGDTWQEFPVMHQKFKDWCEHHPFYRVMDLTDKEVLEEAFKSSPWYGATANDIHWKDRIDVQGILQEYISSAISSTLNLPKGTSFEEVSDIYKYAHRMGLKGATIYVDGSRDGVLVSNDDNGRFEYRDAVKRPKRLDCDIHTTTSKGVKYNVIVGMLDSKPYEVFVTEYFTSESSMSTVKSKQGVYDLFKGDNLFHPNFTSEMTDEQEAITRLLSTSLRHGANIQFLVEQLNKTTGSLFGFTGSLARVLKKYIEDGSKSTVKCTECGSKDVIFEEGCSKCLACGSSKCG